MKTLAPLMLIAGLTVASAASAAMPPASAPKAKPAPAAASKLAACKADWKAQAHHKGSEKQFLKACVAKG